MPALASKASISGARSSRMVSIDPGMSGAVAVLDLLIGEAHAEITEVLDLFDMPLREDAEGVRHVDFRGLVGRLTPFKAEWGFIETQHGMSQQSSVSAWKQAEVYRDAHCALQVTTSAVFGEHGRVWKLHMELSADKDISLTLARQLFPALAPTMLKRKKDEGRAEALLLGVYACRHLLTLPALITI